MREGFIILCDSIFAVHIVIPWSSVHSTMIVYNKLGNVLNAFRLSVAANIPAYKEDCRCLWIFLWASRRDYSTFEDFHPKFAFVSIYTVKRIIESIDEGRNWFIVGSNIHYSSSLYLAHIQLFHIVFASHSCKFLFIDVDQIGKINTKPFSF